MALNHGEIVATSLRNRRSEIADNITNNNALLMMLKKRGRWKDASSGRTLFEPLIWDDGTTGNFKWYGGYEAFDVQPQDEIDAAEYDWKQAATWVIISGLDKIKNAGKAEAVDLLNARTKAALGKMENQISTGLYADGTGNSGKEFGGLQLLVQDDPTSAGTVGGIAQNTYSFWQNQTDTQTLTSSNIVQYMNTMYRSLQRGKDKPQLLLADDTMYGYYETYLQDKQRWQNESKMADAGYTSLRYKQTDIVYDPTCPTKHMYFLNLDYLRFQCHPDRKFSVDEKRVIQNADYEIIPIFLAGNLTCNNRELQGVLIDD